MYIHLTGVNMKQEKLCESEDMTFEDEWDKDGNRIKFLPDNKEYEEELGVENEMVRRQLRDAEILASYPSGLRLTEERKEELKNMKLGEWRDVTEKPKVKLANDRQVAGEHYKRMDIQPWDVVDYGPKEQAIGFYRYNALKYIMRAGEKGAAKEDFAKAQHYLEKLLEIL